MMYLNLDENNYLLSVASVGAGVKAEIDLAGYDLAGAKIRAHKWENDALVFDAERWEEIKAQSETTEGV